MNESTYFISDKRIFYVARDKSGSYLIDSNWMDQSGGYDLVFSGNVYEDYCVFKSKSKEQLIAYLKRYSVLDDKDVPEYDIYRVVETTDHNFEKLS